MSVSVSCSLAYVEQGRSTCFVNRFEGVRHAWQKCERVRCKSVLTIVSLCHRAFAATWRCMHSRLSSEFLTSLACKRVLVHAQVCCIIELFAAQRGDESVR